MTFKKINKILICACFCGLISACSTAERVSPKANKIDVVKADIRHSKQTPSIESAIVNFMTTALAIYTVGKIKNGPELAVLASNHRLRKLEIEKRLDSTISVVRHMSD